MNWKHGYFADAGYTHGHYPETMPLRLYWAALLQGHALPQQGFRYLDAGCGQGVNLVLAAAAHPDSEFVGIDFLPEHIAHARTLAQRCGLTNVRFIEGDFVELAQDPAHLGAFDYAVCHGISTWVAPVVKHSLFTLIGKALKPGGMFYNSYNTLPGWLPATPFQHLVLLEQRSKPGTQALQAAQASMHRLQSMNAVMFSQMPGLTHRLDSMKAHDPAYLVQEYNNQSWQPVFVTQMLDDLAKVKLSYLGTATLSDAYDSNLPSALSQWLAEQTDPALKEQLRDYAVNQSFRRDLYVKGLHKPWPMAHQQQIMALRLVSNPNQARPSAGQPWAFKGGSLEITGDPGFYSTLMDHLDAAADAGVTVGELADALNNAQYKANLLRGVALLVQGGWAWPIHKDAAAVPGNAKTVNAALANAVLEGAPYRYALLPRTGIGCSMTDTDWWLYSLELAGYPTEQLVAELDALLVRQKRDLNQNGQIVTEPSQRQAMLRSLEHNYRQGKRRLLQRFGAL